MTPERTIARWAAAVVLFAALGASAGSGPHTLHAKGEFGWIRFHGGTTVRLSGRGALTLRNESNVRVTLDGKYGEMHKLADGKEYTHFEGSIETIGPGVKLEMRGWDLELSAKGSGRAEFQGQGSTSVDGGEEKSWPGEMTGKGWLKVKYGE